MFVVVEECKKKDRDGLHHTIRIREADLDGPILFESSAPSYATAAARAMEFLNLHRLAVVLIAFNDGDRLDFGPHWVAKAASDNAVAILTSNRGAA